MKKFYKIRRDTIFKIIFTKEENRDLLKRLIKEVINEEVEILNIVVSELNNDKIKIKRKILDVVVKTDKEIINIEINSDNYTSLKRRNAAYIFKLYSDSLDKGERYRDMKKIIQINFSVDKDSNDSFPLISKYMMYDKINDLYYIDNLEIYEINISKFRELCYTCAKEISLLKMLDMDYEQMKDFISEMKMDKSIDKESIRLMDKLKNEAVNVNKDDEVIKLMSDEDEERLLLNTYKDIGEEEGIKKGFEQGVEEGIEQGVELEKKNTARNMKNMGLDTNTIAKVTGLTEKEIKEL